MFKRLVVDARMFDTLDSFDSLYSACISLFFSMLENSRLYAWNLTMDEHKETKTTPACSHSTIVLSVSQWTGHLKFIFVNHVTILVFKPQNCLPQCLQ